MHVLYLTTCYLSRCHVLEACIEKLVVNHLDVIYHRRCLVINFSDVLSVLFHHVHPHFNLFWEIVYFNLCIGHVLLAVEKSCFRVTYLWGSPFDVIKGRQIVISLYPQFSPIWHCSITALGFEVYINPTPIEEVVIITTLKLDPRRGDFKAQI